MLPKVLFPRRRAGAAQRFAAKRAGRAHRQRPRSPASHGLFAAGPRAGGQHSLRGVRMSTTVSRLRAGGQHTGLRAPVQPGRCCDCPGWAATDEPAAERVGARGRFVALSCRFSPSASMPARRPAAARGRQTARRFAGSIPAPAAAAWKNTGSSVRPSFACFPVASPSPHP